MPKFQVLHQVLADGKLHKRGTTAVLSAKDGAVLHSLGHVTPIAPADLEAVSATPDPGLQAMTKSQLVTYAENNFELVLSTKLSKEVLIEKILLAQEAAAPDAVDNEE